MKRLWPALALAFLAIPIAALADDNSSAAATPPHPTLSPAQRQTMFKAAGEFRSKEMQLHQQLRSQVLGALSPEHRTAVANVIGQLAISASPDPGAAAKQIDALLSPSEQQHIVNADTSFRNQSRVLMQQMMAQVKSQLPSPPSSAEQPSGPPRNQRIVTDPGTIVLTTLNRGPMGLMMAHRFGMGPGEPPLGGPPPVSVPPPDNPPPPDAAPPQS